MGVWTYVRIYMFDQIESFYRLNLESLADESLFSFNSGQIYTFFFFLFFCGNIFPHLTIDIDSVGQGEHICAV